MSLHKLINIPASTHRVLVENSRGEFLPGLRCRDGSYDIQLSAHSIERLEALSQKGEDIAQTIERFLSSSH